MLEARLQGACTLDSYSDLETAGLTQTFEFTFELAWKTLKDLLTFVGVDANSPRDVIHEAVAASLLADGATWFDALDRRNVRSHSYDEVCAEQAIVVIRGHDAPMLRAVVASLDARAGA